MRITGFLIFILTFNVSASVWSQNTKMNVKVENSTLQELFTQIENKSNYRFFYNNEDIDVNRKVTIKMENKSIGNILEAAFIDLPYTFKEVNDNLILIERIKESETTKSTPLQQEKTVSGKITDQGGQPLPGVSIIIKGTTHGTVTNFDGEYSLTEVPENVILQFSFVGMKTQEVAVNNQTTINIVMEEETIGLQEVVAIGYGSRQKKNLIGSVDQISSSLIEERPVGNTMQALQGASANLVIQQKSMNPNDNSMNINIRGISTMNNNDPLIVIDGMITEVESLNEINPADIENISVLKDAGSAAIYGSRSSNGVILVTTKMGKKGDKPTVRLNSMVGLQVPNLLYSPVKGYENALLKNQALLNGGSSPVFTPAEIRDLQENGDGEWFLDGILQDAVQQNYNASISGGSETSTYMISTGYYNQKSNFVGDFGVERYNFRTNLTSEYGKLKVGALMAFNRTMQNAPNASAGTLIVDGGRIPPYYYYKMKGENGNYIINDVLSEFNPLGLLEAGGFQKKDNDNFLGNLNLELEVANGLTAKGVVGLDLSANHRYIRGLEVPFYSSETATTPNSYANSTRNTEDYNEKKYILNTQFLLDYNRTFDDVHNVSGLIGVSNESYTRQANEIKMKYTDRDLGLPESETEIDPTSYNTPAQTQERSIYSLFGRAGYSYQDKYYGEFSFRYDGSSKFSEDYRWGFFPSVSGAWRLSEESFMENYKSRFGDLKLRGSYGVLGNQNVDDYSYFTTYTVYTNIYGFNNNSVSGTGFDFGNSELQWEESANFNIGLDATFFQNKLYVSLDYFNKVTSNILLTPVVPSVFGGAVAKENAGEMKNTGWEATISYNARTGAFNHNIRLNIADAKNEVTDFGGNEQIDSSDQMLKIIREGEALGSYFGYKTDGLFQSYEEIENSALPIGATVQPGDVKYVDTNNDGVIDDKDRQILGNAFPRYTFGLTYDLKWKGFDLSMLFQGVGKRDMFLRGELVEPFHANYSYVMYTHQLDYWTPTNTYAKWPRLSAPGSASNTNNYQKSSDIYMFSAAYVRLKNIQLGYTIPQKITSRLGIQKLRISANAQNLFTLAKVSFIDPESTEFGSNMGGTGGTGANSGRNYPTLKYYGFGLELEF
ncbi:SusC/RagA family TonB-linked outer membrane protein [Maribellus comscasis]|uniref:SusC/RagA family TonB-linked outer membrane protein n=2 Tax=Maribellus comscasis TaxID=2681766 RepID=A0A6I6JR36_9BACT|nr:SusC/RagA family TonB-linked outer membrane protein [Maribellus comscasis]